MKQVSESVQHSNSAVEFFFLKKKEMRKTQHQQRTTHEAAQTIRIQLAAAQRTNKE